MSDATNVTKQFDVVVWGATGFTGQIVVAYLLEVYGASSENLRWAVAGRDEAKLSQVQKTLGAEEVPRLLADSGDRQSLDQLVAATQVVLSTVGPYALYGSDLVAACAAAGTHYCDLTGEVQWMRTMIDAHHETAQRTGAKIVHTCGFDSIPSDLGVYYLQQQSQLKFGRPMQTVRYRMAKASGGVSGGTIASMLNMMDEVAADPSVLTILNDPYALNPLNTVTGQDQHESMSPIYDEVLNQWAGPFVMAGINTRVVRRSHALAGMPYGPGFSYGEAALVGTGPKGYLKALFAGVGTWVGTLFAALTPTRRILGKLLPKPGEGPSLEKQQSGFFEVLLHGTVDDAGSQMIQVRVTGDRDPGYGSTAKMIAESAVCLAKEASDGAGGVLTPSIAMGNDLVIRLMRHAGLHFEVVTTRGDLIES